VSPGLNRPAKEQPELEVEEINVSYFYSLKIKFGC